MAGEPVYLILAMAPDRGPSHEAAEFADRPAGPASGDGDVSRAPPLVRIPVGVVIERRKAKSPWVDFVWRPVAVLPGVPDAAPWTALDGDADRTNFYGGAAEIELYRSDTSGYRDNLATGAALLWVVLRPTGLEPPYEIAAVTAEPSEGEALHRERGRSCRSRADA